MLNDVSWWICFHTFMQVSSVSLSSPNVNDKCIIGILSKNYLVLPFKHKFLLIVWYWKEYHRKKFFSLPYCNPNPEILSVLLDQRKHETCTYLILSHFCSEDLVQWLTHQLYNVSIVRPQNVLQITMQSSTIQLKTLSNGLFCMAS